jgi:uncharacterized protein
MARCFGKQVERMAGHVAKLPPGGPELVVAIAEVPVWPKLFRCTQQAEHALGPRERRITGARCLWGYTLGAMRVAITGASGFVGRALSSALTARQDVVVPARRTATEGALCWTVDDGFDPPGALSGFDAVVHLAGESIADGRWTDARKRAIERSRVEGTRRVVDALAQASPRPRVLVSASAVGVYGDTGDREVDEDDARGEGFLADVASSWEDEARRAESLEGVRVVVVRLGVVLERDGGALAKMVPAFKLGLGGRLGSGDQFMAWIHLDDAVRAILHLLDDPKARGVYNLTAPTPVTNRDFTKALGAALHRPTVIPVPRFALSLAFGEMGETVLLQGQRVVSRRLGPSGFQFERPTLDQALRAIFG